MPTDATGLEPTEPAVIVDTSATERASFRRCRRRWYLTSVKRLTRVEGDENLWLGTLVHAGLEGYYCSLMEQGWTSSRPDRDDLHYVAVTAGFDSYQDEYDRSIAPWREYLAFLWPRVEPTYRDLAQLGLDMIGYYFERERTDPMFDEIVAVEERVFVPIYEADSDDVAGKLSVKSDIVGRKDGVLGVGDHKTAGREPSVTQLDLDDQLTAEVYAVWIGGGQGEFPEEAVYNVLQKKVPAPPKTLKKLDKLGRPTLSKDKNQATTHDVYLAEVRRLGLDEADYADALTRLRNEEEMGESPFFQRHRVIRTEAQMASFEQNLSFEFQDMRAIGEDPRRAYPNPSPFNCPSCPVRVVCLTMQDDGDVAAIVKASYAIGDPRR